MSLWKVKDMTPERFVELGFTESKGEHPFDTCWEYNTPKFEILIDAFGDITLARKDVESDYIEVTITDLADLKTLLDWVA